MAYGDEPLPKNWAEIRDAQREKDKYACQACGVRNKHARRVAGYESLEFYFNVHHVIPRTTEVKYFERDFVHSSKNLVTLCEAHHLNQYGVHKSAYLKKQLEQEVLAAWKEQRIARFNRRGKIKEKRKTRNKINELRDFSKAFSLDKILEVNDAAKYFHIRRLKKYLIS